MDVRQNLKAGAILSFEGMCCVVEDAIGRGSNAIVYKGYYLDHRESGLKHHILIKELFPYHPAGAIWRDEDGTIVTDPEAQDDFELHRRSFERGNRVHLNLLSKSPDAVGANLNTFEKNGTLYSVLGFTGGRSLDKVFEEENEKVTLRSAAERMIRILDALEAFHAEGLLHLDISPDNILVIGEDKKERVMLIDFNSVHTIGELVSGRGDYLSLKNGYTAPEIVNRSLHTVSEKTDIYALAAVFYRMITGKTLTLADALKRMPPDAQDVPMVKDAPETAKNMVKTILRRALSVIPQRRYENVSEMRDAFAELIDRIDMVGVTHGSIWEGGKRSVEKLIKTNAFYRYIASGDGLYPVRVSINGESMPLGDCVKQIVSKDGKNTLLKAEGGMGKTTALLLTALIQNERYLVNDCAVVYIPLYGYKEGDGQFIRNSVLGMLRFSGESVRYEDARHQLQALFGEARPTKEGLLPRFLLLLDGLNEATGDTADLIAEINMLSAMPGVRLIISSRNSHEALNAAEAAVEQLSEEDINQALSRKGLLLPESEEIRALIRTPLVLSLFIQASGDEGQLTVHSKEELIHKYLLALIEKETDVLTDDSHQKWQLEAAVWFVLPCISEEMNRAGGALDEKAVLKAVKKCMRFLKSPNMQRAFPKWIGHTKDIIAGAKTAEEWYGQIVNDILWKRLGMLLRDENNLLRASHQVICSYLSVLDRHNRKRLARRRLLFASGVSLASVLVVFAAVFAINALFVKTPYSIEQSDNAMTYTTNEYSEFNELYTAVAEIVQAARDGDVKEFENRYEIRIRAVDRIARPNRANEREAAYIQKMKTTEGEVMYSSKKPFAFDEADSIMTRNTDRAALYQEMLKLLDFWVHDETLKSLRPDVPDLLMNVLESDAYVESWLYEIVCAPHAQDAEDVWTEERRKVIAFAKELNQYRNDTMGGELKQQLENAKVALDDAETKLRAELVPVQKEYNKLGG